MSGASKTKPAGNQMSGTPGSTTQTSLITVPATRSGTLMTLNGLRGIAAFCVMTYHRPDWFYPHFLFTDAYLAVDFFFMLSGFVLARAYVGKIPAKLSRREFMSRRLQRLFPLTFLGGALGGLVFFANHHGHVSLLLLPDTFSTMLTVPSFWDAGGWRLDPPMWSLFYELLINIIFGLIISHLGGVRLWAFVLVAAVFFVAFYPIEYFGYRDGVSEFLSDMIRVTLLFFLGVLLERLNSRGVLSRFRLGLTVGGLLVVGSFMIHDGTPAASAIRLFVVLLLYPAIILGSANHEPTGVLRRVAEFSGNVSYPLYLLHFPFLAFIAGLSLKLHHSKQPTSLVEAIARFAVVIGLSWLALKLYDEPVRRVLARWWRRRSRAETFSGPRRDSAVPLP